ncbi:MAG: hypothetical protein E7C49_00065 [Clostridium sp.]|nr:hypothetical protein [Clostridium sp.]
MKLKLKDDFLDKYHIKDRSSYNNNYYRLPFYINCDGVDYNILHITCDEFSNEYNYALCYDLDNENDIFTDERYIVPSFANDYYLIDFTNYSKEYEWY